LGDSFWWNPWDETDFNPMNRLIQNTLNNNLNVLIHGPGLTSLDLGTILEVFDVESDVLAPRTQLFSLDQV